jgi:hypothetical protein
MFRFFSTRPFDSPCFIANRKGATDMRFYNLRWDGTPFFAPVWFGNNVGVTGVNTQQYYENYLHLCHTSMAEVNDGYVAYRVENYITNMASYTVILQNVSLSPPSVNRFFPEIMKFATDYGGTLAPEDNMTFLFYPG